jgi:ribonuclease P protein subunit RPR2
MTGGKGKSNGKPKAGPLKYPRHQAQARMSFLFQAARYLSELPDAVKESASHGTEQKVKADISRNSSTKREVTDTKHPEASATEISDDTSLLKTYALPAYLANHMFSVGLKSHAKLDRDEKRRICKRCKCFLIEGKTSTTMVENKSRGSKKPWADVTVVCCIACGMQKRYPVGTKKPRQSMNSANQEGKVSELNETD